VKNPPFLFYGEEMKVACIQLKAGDHYEKNLQQAIRLMEQAVAKGAKIISFPEHFLFHANNYYKQAEKIPGETTEIFCNFAKTNRIGFVLGSFAERSTRTKKVYNTSVIIDQRGSILGKYQKQCLFRAKLKTSKRKNVDETREFLPGKRPGIFRLLGYRIGIGICFDLRFFNTFKFFLCFDFFLFQLINFSETGLKRLQFKPQAFHFLIFCLNRPFKFVFFCLKFSKFFL